MSSADWDADDDDGTPGECPLLDALFDDPEDDTPDPEDVRMGLAIPKGWACRTRLTSFRVRQPPRHGV